MSMAKKIPFFTGDAGVPALAAALDYAQQQGISIEGLQFFDVRIMGAEIISAEYF